MGNCFKKHNYDDIGYGECYDKRNYRYGTDECFVKKYAEDIDLEYTQRTQRYTDDMYEIDLLRMKRY